MEIRLRRRLDLELVRRGIATGRDDAKRLIGTGAITVDGSSMLKASTLVSDSAAIAAHEAGERWASRGGLKLAHALEVFAISPEDKRCLDVGASTGGFTDVLLAGGAAGVTAVDVGYGQLVWRLRQDPRVTVLDRTNIRTADPAGLGAPFDLVVVDVSFISVRLIAGALAAAGRAGSDYVVLVKPQFEVGRERVGSGGIVTDANDRLHAIVGVRDALQSVGIGALGLTRSPITGAKGNVEFLLHAGHGAAAALSDAAAVEETRT